MTPAGSRRRSRPRSPRGTKRPTNSGRSWRNGGGRMANYRKGRRLEHRARKLLEDAGFSVVRAAGSKGPADLVAFDAIGFRLISVKSAGRYASAIEREVLQLLPRP